MTRLSAPAEPRRTTTNAQKTPLEKLHAKAKNTAAQDALGFQLKAAGISHEVEYRWDALTKRRADFAVWNRDKLYLKTLLVEVDGGLFLTGAAMGGHTRGAARERDYERDAEAMLLGFRVLRVSPRHVKNGKAIGWIQALLK